VVQITVLFFSHAGMFRNPAFYSCNWGDTKLVVTRKKFAQAPWSLW
jgi:hypothetical protein